MLNIARTANRWLVADIKTPLKAERMAKAFNWAAPMKWQALRMICRRQQGLSEVVRDHPLAVQVWNEVSHHA